MFTGIIEDVGMIERIETEGNNKTFWIKSAISKDLKVDQSVSHSGVCLTVEDVRANLHRVTAIDETLKKTNLDDWNIGSLVNLERCMLMNGRIDGHIVQGHVDSTATCVDKTDFNGSWQFTFAFPEQFGALVIEKGSISLNGISLTIFNVASNKFTVAIIPYTFEHTNIKQVEPGTKVNIEFDMIGKYIQRITSLNK
jgi:riboflavin synthase